MINKKSQVAGQILMYILAIIVFSLTLIYGYKAVKYFSDRGTEISYLQMENDIISEIKKIESDTTGTIKKKTLTIPGNYNHVCFVNSYPTIPTIILPEYPLIRDHVSSAKDKNMFLAPPGDVSSYVGDIEIDGGVLCVPVKGGKITIRIESMGNRVKISE